MFVNISEKKSLKRPLDDDSDSSDEESALSDEEKMEFFEESSESEPDLECDSWDDDCKVISKNFIDSHIIGSNKIIYRHYLENLPIPLFRTPNAHLQQKSRGTFMQKNETDS